MASPFDYDDKKFREMIKEKEAEEFKRFITEGVGAKFDRDMERMLLGKWDPAMDSRPRMPHDQEMRMLKELERIGLLSEMKIPRMEFKTGAGFGKDYRMPMPRARRDRESVLLIGGPQHGQRIEVDAGCVVWNVLKNEPEFESPSAVQETEIILNADGTVSEKEIDIRKSTNDIVTYERSHYVENGQQKSFFKIAGMDHSHAHHQMLSITGKSPGKRPEKPEPEPERDNHHGKLHIAGVLFYYERVHHCCVKIVGQRAREAYGIICPRGGISDVHFQIDGEVVRINQVDFNHGDIVTKIWYKDIVPF